jgi:hypothetical protein
VNKMSNRRAFLAALAAAIVTGPAYAAPAANVDVYFDPD